MRANAYRHTVDRGSTWPKLVARLLLLIGAAASPATASERLPPPAELNGLNVLSTAQADRELLASEPFLAETAAGSPLSVRLGAVLLQRDRPQAEVLMYEVASGNTLLDASDLVFPFQGGVDAGLVWRGSVADLELRYFGVEDVDARYGPVSSPGTVQLTLPGVEPFPGPVTTAIAAHSALQSVEINVRRNVGPRLTWLAGFRYVSFRDALKLYAGDQPLDNYGLATFGTTNELFGLQIGADAIVWQPSARFHVESTIKAGVYANAAGSTLTVFATDDEEGIRLPMYQDTTAFVGDLSFVGVYQLNRRWAVRAGYQLLWLSGVATGPLQFHNLSFDPGQFSTNTSATVFYHGALVGLERSW